MRDISVMGDLSHNLSQNIDLSQKTQLTALMRYEDLIDAGADVNQRAIGSFFLPRDQQGYRPAKNTDYEGLAYLGEFPLAWAACCANESVYNLLLDVGADPDAQDSFGNMILHMVVVCDKLDMFGYALRHPKLPARNGIINNGGLTPLTLACTLGRAEVFREMLELSAREFWRYSNITCSGYPLNALDTLLPDGRTNWNSALFIILNGTKEEHLDMLDGGIIQRLLEEKWKTFAQAQFLKRLLILFAHLFCMSISIYLRPESEKTQPEGAAPTESPPEEDDDYDVTTIIRYCAEICTVIGVLSFVIFQQGDEVKNQGLVAFLRQLPTSPPKFIFLISNLLILACIPCRIAGDTDTEEAMLLFAVPGSWFLLMFFAGAVRLTGPFVTMIYSMITGDMFTFFIIYTIVLNGFSQAFFFLYKGHPQVSSSLFATYPSTWMALFQTTLGDYNYADLSNTTYPSLAKTVFVIFMIFVPILLLNMLIAMMGNTYALVIERSEKEWMKQWAKIVVTLERAVSQADAKKYLEDYSISLGPSNDDSGFEQRGVMVIKSKSKTRAKQRKGAVSNWKRVGKVTLNALKKRGLTGEELRRIMWGRASISSPKKVTKKKRDPNDPFAISAAIDVMSFTHDIVLCGDEALDGTVQQALPPGKKGVKGMLHPQQLMRQDTHVSYKDPLRELVLISEVLCVNDKNFMANVQTLAREATVLEHIQEVPLKSKEPEKPPAPKAPPSPKPAAGLQTAATTLFQNPKDVIDPEKEKAFLKQLEALEDTDSEAFGDRPVLGKISLIRRAKSAVSRSASAKRRHDEHPLFHIAWDEPRTDQPMESTPPAQSPPLQDEGVDNEAYEPAEDEELVTVDDVKRQMEAFHLRPRKQSVDSQSATVERTKGETKSSEGPSSSSKNGKYAKGRKIAGRTSKNKVSPADGGVAEKAAAEEAKKKRGKSAPQAGKAEKEGETVPDPLEPWSTRELTTMNKLLDTEEEK
ncbi:Transient receptor potential cation channel subfamily V [Sergentomyia squamirostris]